MKKRVYIVIVFCAMLMLGPKSHAKYVLQDKLDLHIYIDKTPPQIELVCEGQTESFLSSNLRDIQKRSCDVGIVTSDNVGIKKNEYYFNTAEPSFDGLASAEFASGQVFSEEGFYKIVAIDISGNKNEIIVLIDKTAPEVNVQYFKRGEIIACRKVVAKSNNWASSNIIDKENQEDEKILENENVVHEEVKHKNEQNIVKNELAEQENTVQNQVNFAENTVTENEIENKVTTEDTEGDMSKKTLQEQEKSQELPENTVQEFIEPEEEKTSQVEKEPVEMSEQILKQAAVENFVELPQELEISSVQENQVMLMAISDAFVGNEAEFRDALANQASVIHVRQSIDFTSPIYINYPVTIVAEGASNSLRYANPGSFIVVQNGGELVLNSMVVDTKSSGVSGVTAINIQSGGYVTFIYSSILDGGSGNTGILVNNEATLLLWSCEIVNCGYGINLQMNGNLLFATQEGRGNNFYYNMVGVFIDNFSRNCDFNQNIFIHDNINGILVANSSGTVNVSAGEFYNNHNGINCGGSVNISGGTFYNNANGITANNTYSGKLTVTNANIYSNKQYAIYHDKTIDGGCTILGGNISGEVFLGQNDNYINTAYSYPTFTVTPATYYFKRKLVKTSSNNIAQNEISKVTVTPKESWYKYVDNEYIVLWQGGNVIVQYQDYYGKILTSEIITGDIGTQYQTNAKIINGYDLVSVPINSTGSFGREDIIVVYKYDLVNCAKVHFEDLLSGVICAKYWYNATEEKFSGDGTDFVNNTVFENYGYYKIVVQNGVRLTKEITFLLNKDSIKR